MSPDALATWETLHVQAEAAIVWYFTAEVASLSLYVYTLVYGAPTKGDYVNVFRVPLVVSIVITGFLLCCVWRLGQQFLKTVAFKAKFPVVFLTFLCLIVFGYICPGGAQPFGTSLHFTAVLVVHVFVVNCTIWLLPFTLPPEPHKDLVSLGFKSLMITLRTIDTCTDLSYLHVLEFLVRAYLWF